MSPRRLPGQRRQFGVIVNPTAGQHRPASIRQLTEGLLAAGVSYHLVEPSSAQGTIQTARDLARASRLELTTKDGTRRGKLTGLIAVGGDGTANLAARAALEAELPIGFWPTGRCNNLARSIYDDLDGPAVIKQLTTGSMRSIDTGLAGDQPFWGAIGVGLLPELLESLGNRPIPRGNLAWSRLLGPTAARVSAVETAIGIDAIRLTLSPLLVSIHLQPYAAGIPFVPMALPDDGCAELICDCEPLTGGVGPFVRNLIKGTAEYGEATRMYRGRRFVIQSEAGRPLYLDGEIIKLPSRGVEVSVGPNQLSILAAA